MNQENDEIGAKLSLQERLGIAWQAYLDRRQGIPSPDSQEPPAFIKRTMNQVLKMHNKIAESASRQLYDIKRMNTNEQIIELEKENYYAAKRRLDEVRESVHEIKQRIMEQEHTLFHPLWSWAAIALITYSEFPVNSFVFSVFAANKSAAALLAAGLCLSIPLIAHAAGKESKIKGRITFKFGVLAAILFAFFVVSALLRGPMMAALASVARDNLGIQISNGVAIILFILLNVILAGAAYITAHLATPRDYQNIKTNKEMLRWRTQQLEEAHKACERQDAAYRKALQGTGSAYDRATALRLQVKSQADQARAAGWNRIALYWQVNKRGRVDGNSEIVSEKFKPEYPFPETLTEVLGEIREFIAEQAANVGTIAEPSEFNPVLLRKVEEG